MKATLGLESIGDDLRGTAKYFGQDMPLKTLSKIIKTGRASAAFRKRPWVAELTSLLPNGEFSRKFLQYFRDYSKADETGSRGVYQYYILEERHIYEVFSHIDWKSSTRYFCRVIGSKIEKITEEEARQCLKNRSESTS